MIATACTCFLLLCDNTILPFRPKSKSESQNFEVSWKKNPVSWKSFKWVQFQNVKSLPGLQQKWSIAKRLLLNVWSSSKVSCNFTYVNVIQNVPHQLRGLGERCKLPSGVRGKAPAAVDFCAFWTSQNACGNNNYCLASNQVTWSKLGLGTKHRTGNTTVLPYWQWQ